MAQLERILQKPLITEKAAVMTEKSNRYGFEVALNANKNQIKTAVEKLYNVKVLDVTTSIRPGRVKRTAKGVSKTSKIKKAYVQLSVGQKIEFFKGV